MEKLQSGKENTIYQRETLFHVLSTVRCQNQVKLSEDVFTNVRYS